MIVRTLITAQIAKHVTCDEKAQWHAFVPYAVIMSWWSQIPFRSDNANKMAALVIGGFIMGGVFFSLALYPFPVHIGRSLGSMQIIDSENLTLLRRTCRRRNNI